MAPLQAALEQAFAELTTEIQQSHEHLNENLAAHGFAPPNDLEEWEGPTRLLPQYIWRLMILGNFLLRCDIAPDDIYQWFVEMFIGATIPQRPDA